MMEAKRNDGEVPGQTTLPHPGSSSSGLFSAPHRRDAKEQMPFFCASLFSGEFCERLSMAGRLMNSDSWDGWQDG